MRQSSKCITSLCRIPVCVRTVYFFSCFVFSSVNLQEHVNISVILSLLIDKTTTYSQHNPVTTWQGNACVYVCVCVRACGWLCCSVFFSQALSAEAYTTCHWGADAILFFSSTSTRSLMNMRFMHSQLLNKVPHRQGSLCGWGV